jgi:hypothetical protein
VFARICSALMTVTPMGVSRCGSLKRVAVTTTSSPTVAGARSCA